MKILSMEELVLEAGTMIQRSGMDIYNGKEFECACGSTHEFSDHLDYRNFATNGANAQMIVTCPHNSNIATLIKTKYKFLVIFDKFISLAGTKV